MRPFHEMVEIAARLSGGNNRLKDTIAKEILHHEILIAMQRADLGKELVFQGGTALRLCHNNPRYSEDLDFCRNVPLDPVMFEKFRNLLTEAVVEKHGLNCRVKEPNKPLEDRTSQGYIAVHRWTAVIEMEGKGVRNHKIHIEVADVPAYDESPRMIISPYQKFGSGPVMMRVSSAEEIMADKVVAIAGRSHLKARDIWDMKFLHDSGYAPNIDWVVAKAKDYQLGGAGSVNDLRDLLSLKAEEIRKPETIDKFRDEMGRFLARDQAGMWIADPKITEGLLAGVARQIERQVEALAPKAMVAGVSESVVADVANKWTAIEAMVDCLETAAALPEGHAKSVMLAAAKALDDDLGPVPAPVSSAEKAIARRMAKLAKSGGVPIGFRVDVGAVEDLEAEAGIDSPAP